jgi:hypothetical protein
VSSLEIGGIVFACTFGGAVAGMLLRAVIPDPHLSGDSKDVIKMGTGLIATLSAMVLGLMVASAKSSFDAQRTGMQQMAANFVVLDRGLAKYGPESEESRKALRRLVEKLLEVQSEKNVSAASSLGATSLSTESSNVYDQVRALVPKTESQRWLQSQAIQLSSEFARTRWLLNEQQGSAIPTPFLVVVVFWLTALFLSFALFSRPNPLVIVTLLICALSVGGAIFLISDLDQPSAGLIRIPTAPLENALSQLGH